MYGWKLELYLILAEVGGLTRPRPVAKEGLPYFYFAGEKYNREMSVQSFLIPYSMR